MQLSLETNSLPNSQNRVSWHNEEIWYKVTLDLETTSTRPAIAVRTATLNDGRDIAAKVTYLDMSHIPRKKGYATAAILRNQFLGRFTK